MSKTSFFARLCTLLLIVFVSSSGSVAAFDFAEVKLRVKEAVEKTPNSLKLADLGYFKVLPAGQIVLSKTRFYEASSGNGMIILTGRGKLPVEFRKLAGKDSDIVITISPDAATSRETKDMLCTLTGFFEAEGLGSFYEKMDDNVFKEMLAAKFFYSHSNARQTLTGDMFPEEVRQKFAAVLGKDFALTLYDGLTLTAPVNFNPKNARLKVISDFARLLNVDKMGIIASIFLSPDWKHITLKALLGDGFKIGFLPDFFGHSVPYLFVNLSEFGIGFETTLKLPPEGRILSGVCQMSVPILFGSSSAPETNAADDGAIAAQIKKAAATAGKAFEVQKLNPTRKDSAVLLGSISGTWENALGFKGFDIYDLVIKGEVPLYVTSLVLGIGGRVDIGSVQLAVGGKLPVGFKISDAAFSGKVSRIPFGELISMIGKSSGEKKEKAEIPIEKLALSNVVVSVAANDDRDLNIKAGLAFAAALEFDGQELGMVDVRTTHPEQTGVLKPFVGFKTMGWLREISFGPLKITGNGPDGKRGNKDDGVYVDLAYGTKLSDYFKLSGLIKLFGIEREAQVAITNDTIDVFTRTKVFNLYESEVTLRGKLDTKKPDFLARVALTETFADDVVKHTTEFLNDAVEEMTESVEDAKEDFDNAAENLNDAQKDAARGLDAFKKDVEKFAEKIEKAEKKVKRLDKKLDKKEKQLKNLKWNKFKKRATLVAQIAGLKPALTAAKLALKTLNGLMSEKNLDKAAEGLKKVAEETLKLAEKGLEEASKKLAEAQKLAEQASSVSAVMKDFGKNFKIEEAGFEMALAQLLKSKSPKLYFKAVTFGKQVEGEALFDFSEPQKSFLTLAKAIFEKLAEKEKALGEAGKVLLESL